MGYWHSFTASSHKLLINYKGYDHIIYHREVWQTHLPQGSKLSIIDNPAVCVCESPPGGTEDCVCVHTEKCVCACVRQALRTVSLPSALPWCSETYHEKNARQTQMNGHLTDNQPLVFLKCQGWHKERLRSCSRVKETMHGTHDPGLDPKLRGK